MGMMGFRFLMMLVALVVLGAILAAAVWAVVTFTNRSRPDDAARRTLDERYARGEIGDDEYQRMKRQLG
jgi:putative membrane protein